MDTRRTKQVAYGTLYLIIAGGVVAGIYFSFLYHPASCFDNIQNQGEAGIDCGGPCAKVCVPQSVGISKNGGISLFNIFPERSSLPIRYTALAQVLNTNSGFASPDFGFRFDFYGASSTLIKSVSGHSFIYGGEVKYLIAPNEELQAPVDHVALVIEGPTWVSADELGLKPKLTARLTGTVDASTTVTVNGELVNGDVSAFSNILVVAIFKDGTNTPIGATQTIVDQIGPNTTQPFSVVYPVRPGLDPSRTELYAYALRQ